MAEGLLIRGGLWESPLRRFAGRLDRSIRRLWLGSRLPESAIVQGHKMFFPSHFHKAYLEMISGYHPYMTRAMLDLCKPGMRVIDLGANIGYYTLLAARSVGPEGHVYAFEPNSSGLAFLARSIQSNGYGDIVTVVPKAVSNKSGIVPLFVHEEADCANSLYKNYNAASISGSVLVEAITLDEFAARIGWPRIDIIKVNIEGAEKAALEGMAELCRRSSELKLIVEFNSASMEAAGVSPAELFNVLHDRGFSRFAMIGKSLSRVSIPGDIDRVIHSAQMGQGQCAYLLCEKA